MHIHAGNIKKSQYSSMCADMSYLCNKCFLNSYCVLVWGQSKQNRTVCLPHHLACHGMPLLQTWPHPTHGKCPQVPTTSHKISTPSLIHSHFTPATLATCLILKHSPASGPLHLLFPCLTCLLFPEKATLACSFTSFKLCSNVYLSQRLTPNTVPGRQ
jgi:hypothetical protein